MVINISWLTAGDTKNCSLLTAYCALMILPARFAVAAVVVSTTTTTTTAAITTETAPATATAKATTAAATAIFAWFGFVNFERAATDFFAIELIDGSGGLFRRGHFDEGEPS